MNENFKLIDLIDEKKLLYICGNGGAGKTTYAKKIKTQLENAGKSVNMISTDDFITNTKVRNNSVGFWTKSGGAVFWKIYILLRRVIFLERN